jgi:hypothetical protein
VSRTYITNELGDIHQVDEGGAVTPVDPSDWGWVTPGGRKDHAEMRRSIDALRALPGFDVEEQTCDRFEPGPRTRKSTWGKWVDGSAPPAAVLSRDGKDGTLGYYDRLSEAVGNVALRLPAMPERSPMLIYDFVAGRLFRVAYTPPAPTPAGLGTVYILEDGFGIKVGYTNGSVAKRIGELQTGNPRRITVIAEIGSATSELEDHIHTKLNEWNITGEWFARGPLVAQAASAGGFENWLRKLVGDAEWPIAVHPPYM